MRFSAFCFLGAALLSIATATLSVLNVNDISFRLTARSMLLLDDTVRTTVDLELKPFCNSAKKGDKGAINENNCAAWEEQEADMILMLLDLLAQEVPETVAVEFYSEIRCLSRSNLFYDDKSRSFRVCFKKDYSRIVGQLLAKYIRPVFDELDRETSLKSLNPSVKFSVPTTVRNADVDAVFAQLSAAEQKQLTLANSCCRKCATTGYFVNFQISMCVNNPTGAHCCHTVCKSLDRLKIGMSNSVGYCCPDLYPQYCMV